MNLSRRSFLGTAAAAVAGTAAAASSWSSRALAVSAADDVVGKIRVGYQGWFACIGDGAPINAWWHWSQNESQPPSPSNNNLEAWPDMREYLKWYHTAYANLHDGDAANLMRPTPFPTRRTATRTASTTSRACFPVTCRRTSVPTATSCGGSSANNMSVTAENADASSLIANRTAIGTWEQFTLIADN